MKIPDKYKPQGYFTRVNKEKTIRKGKGYQYRAIFAIWDGQKWHTQSNTKGLTTKGLADEWLDAKVKELTEKGKDIMLNPETVKGFAEAHYKPFLRDHKKIQYEYEFQKLDVIYEFLGDKLIDEVNKLDVLAFKTWLLKRPYKRGKGEKKRSEASANRYLPRLRGPLEQCIDFGMSQLLQAGIEHRRGANERDRGPHGRGTANTRTPTNQVYER